MRNMITQAGDANSFTIVTMHDTVSPFDTTFLSSKLVGAQGKKSLKEGPTSFRNLKLDFFYSRARICSCR